MYLSQLHKILYALFIAILLLSSSVNAAYMSQNVQVSNAANLATNIKSELQYQQTATQQSHHCSLQCDHGCNDCSQCSCCRVLPRTGGNAFHLLSFPPLVIARVSKLLPIEYLQESLVLAVIKSIYRPPIA
ncbi:hypothetical protein BTO08_10745 [Photobacterium angustum]|uniref:DUF2946 domain-containing protein n=2 Tax=Photobacterium angustum TaxID=661 RepID=A0A2S7W1V0_PHOAN|nr:hypothetical protein BTO08_10745 [Photobacterium angustum]